MSGARAAQAPELEGEAMRARHEKLKPVSGLRAFAMPCPACGSGPQRYCSSHAGTRNYRKDGTLEMHSTRYKLAAETCEGRPGTGGLTHAEWAPNVRHLVVTHYACVRCSRVVDVK